MSKFNTQAINILRAKRPTDWEQVGMVFFAAMEGASIPFAVLSLASLVFTTLAPTIVVPIFIVALISFTVSFAYDAYQKSVRQAQYQAETTMVLDQYEKEHGLIACQDDPAFLVFSRHNLHKVKPFLQGVGLITGIWTFMGLLSLSFVANPGSLLAMVLLSFVVGITSVFVDHYAQLKEKRINSLTQRLNQVIQLTRQSAVLTDQFFSDVDLPVGPDISDIDWDEDSLNNQAYP